MGWFTRRRNRRSSTPVVAGRTVYGSTPPVHPDPFGSMALGYGLGYHQHSEEPERGADLSDYDQIGFADGGTSPILPASSGDSNYSTSGSESSDYSSRGSSQDSSYSTSGYSSSDSGSSSSSYDSGGSSSYDSGGSSGGGFE